MIPAAGSSRRFSRGITAGPIQGGQCAPGDADQESSEAAQLPRAAAAAGVEDILPDLFRDRVVNDGIGMIKLDTDCIVEPGGRLRVAVEVNWPMILANAVARLYIVADANREPLLAQVLLIPDIVPPHVCIDA